MPGCKYNDHDAISTHWSRPPPTTFHHPPPPRLISIKKSLWTKRHLVYARSVCQWQLYGIITIQCISICKAGMLHVVIHQAARTTSSSTANGSCACSCAANAALFCPVWKAFSSGPRGKSRTVSEIGLRLLESFWREPFYCSSIRKEKWEKEEEEEKETDRLKYPDREERRKRNCETLARGELLETNGYSD